MLSLDEVISRVLRCAGIALLGLSLLACSDDSNPAAPADRGNAGDQGNQDDNSDDDSGDTNTKPTATLSVGETLGAMEAVTVTFSEAMNPESLALAGALATGVQLEWKSSDTLELSPVTYWPVGAQELVIDASDAEGLAMDTLTAEIMVESAFSTFQSADVVIGQQDFTTGYARQSPDAPAAGPNTLDHPSSAVAYAADKDLLFIGDTFDKRVLAFQGVPDVNNAVATFVIGQPDFTSTAGETSRDKVRAAQGISARGNRLMIADPDSHRVTVYSPLPESGPAQPHIVLGQANFEDFNNACGPTRMNHVHNQFVTPAGKLLVADSANSRVLVWNEIPQEIGVSPDLVIGQSNLDNCAHNDDDQNNVSLGNGLPTARTLWHPTGIWSDGERLAIVDNYNNRVLLWHEFPTENFAAADVVLGQQDMHSVVPNDVDGDGVSDSPTAQVVNHPWSVWFERNQLYLADMDNNRVLIWNGWPEENFAPADIVLGQESFDSNAPNLGGESPTAASLDHPMGVRVIADELLVTDTNNSRVLIFDAQ